jgi:hypothetical protein
MVPLEKLLRTGTPKPKLNLVQLQRPVPPKPAPEPDAPTQRHFKVVDVMTRETLAEQADAQKTVELLGRFRSIVDVQVYVWNPGRRRWRLLGLDEQRVLWNLRVPGAPVSDAA